MSWFNQLLEFIVIIVVIEFLCRIFLEIRDKLKANKRGFFMSSARIFKSK